MSELENISIDEPTNHKILSVSEDRIQGFVEDPMQFIADETGLDRDLVIERIQLMMKAGTIRRVRQTLLANNLAPGALVAWQLPADKINDAFEYMHEQDPFSGHVVLRTTDTVTAGSDYKLWTTVKVPLPYSLTKHCEWLKEQVGATNFLTMKAKRLFALGVGHARRQNLQPGDRSDEPGRVIEPNVVTIDERDWRVLMVLKREFEIDEIKPALWEQRAAEIDMSIDEFYEVGKSLNARGIIGRFSTFLEHVKPNQEGKRVTRYNALFHWAVPEGMELEAGKEVGRHYVMTHGYWREGGPEFKNVNIMGVAHGTDKDLVLAHKAAIDEHLEEAGIPIAYTNVFWGGRSEIKPSEVSPIAYEAFCKDNDINLDSMKL